MIYIFDLDDTLYDEQQYVESGLRAVAQMAQQQWQLDANSAFDCMLNLLHTQGRGRIFDDWLIQHGISSKANILRCISCYRMHKPTISMSQVHHALIQRLPKPLYLVTDGNKIVQHNKIAALGITQYFKRIFITHRFGIKHAKPSVYCFELIKKAERCEWQDMVYIGDNPAKDFVNLNKKGTKTIRILTGSHKDRQAEPGYDAHIRLNTLIELHHLLEGNHNYA